MNDRGHDYQSSSPTCRVRRALLWRPKASCWPSFRHAIAIFVVSIAIPAYQMPTYHHGFIPGALPIQLFMDFEVLQNFSRLRVSVVRGHQPTATSQRTSLPFQPPPAIMPCGREGVRGEKAMEPVPASSPPRTCRHSPLNASKSLTVESCPPLWF